MKQNWTVSEVEETWTLSGIEQSFVNGKKGSNRLVFAIMLKFFQFSSRFPVSTDHVPFPIVNFVAKQVKSSTQTFRVSDLGGRSAFRNRVEIREFLGIRKPVAADAENLVESLVSETLPLGNWSKGFLTEKCYDYFNRYRLEPLSPSRITALTGGAIRRYEQRLFLTISERLSVETRTHLDCLIEPSSSTSDPNHTRLNDVRTDDRRAGLDSVLDTVSKIRTLRTLGLEADVFSGISPKVLARYASRVMTEPPNELRAHPETTRYAMLAIFCHERQRKLTDNLIDLLIRIVGKYENSAKNRVVNHLAGDMGHVDNKGNLLYRIARASVNSPEGKVRDVIFPIVGEGTLHDIVKEHDRDGTYLKMIRKKTRLSYKNHYRRILSPILGLLEFHPSNPVFVPLTTAIGIIRRYFSSGRVHYPDTEEIPIEGIALDTSWRNILFGEMDGEEDEPPRISRITYELTVLHSLCHRLYHKQIWVEGAYRYGNPEKDLPVDFEEKKEHYFCLLGLPLHGDEMVAECKETMRHELEMLDEELPGNRYVKILEKKKSHIRVTPIEKQEDPPNVKELKQAVFSRWSSTTLLDVLKETNFRLDLCSLFETTASRQHLDRENLVRRLLLSLYGYGTNTGLKRVSSGNPGVNYQDLRYVRRRFISPVNVRDAIIRVTDAIFETRLEEIWGEGTTACAGDSVKFGSWDQNLMSEWHVRYRGPGIMIYWHVDAKSACIHSQLKRCSSSEVASMIKGIIDHCTTMDAKKGYSDTHGQSLIGFAFSRLLMYELLPRLKGIHRQKLHLPDKNCRYENLKTIIKGTINWQLIIAQYDQMVKYAVAMKTGIADPETILRRFTDDGENHPVYLALQELGKAIKTIFLCRYLRSVELRREIHEALNVVESWNNTNSFIFYGRHGEMNTNRSEEQELAMFCLHLLQNCLVYINTIMIQTVLAEPEWKNRLTDEDRRALCPLINEHINPYGLFPLDLRIRLIIEGEAA